MFKSHLQIDGKRIGPGEKPYIIAEASANHRGDIEVAKNLIKIAKDCGADAVKLQTYTADTITINCDRPEFKIKGGLWDGYTLYDLYKEAHTPFEWHQPLFNYANEIGITVFSSVFDETSVDLLESLNAPAYKIASFEAIDLPLIRRTARTGKPLIISTGMANELEIENARNAAYEAGCRELCMLHCVSAYPAPAEDCNLQSIPNLSKRFGVVSGLSDHTMGTTIPVAAVALGASVIEKHFTTARADGGPDSAFSLEPGELKELCDNTRMAFAALGKPTYDLAGSESGNRQFRRSLYIVKDIAEGELFTNDNVRSIRPGFGMQPEKISSLLGRKAPRALIKGTPVTEDLLSGT